MKILMLILFPLLFGCITKTSENSNLVCNTTIDSIILGKDKEQIANCFVDKIEYFRRYHNYKMTLYINSSDSLRSEYNNYYKKYPEAMNDPENFFEPYASRDSIFGNQRINSPIPTNMQIKVITDLILYNKTQLLCFAFLGIEGKYSRIEGIKEMREKNRNFDAKAIIGCRSNINEPFEIYPVTKFGIFGFESYEKAVKELELLYFSKLKDDSLEGTLYVDENKFNTNVGDVDFFEKSPFFKKASDGCYFFQLYREFDLSSKTFRFVKYRYKQCY